MGKTPDRTSKYRADSLTLIGAVALGAGVMIGAGIFALTGQMAEVKITSDPVVLVVAAVVMAVILIGKYFFLRQRPADDQPEHSHQ